MDIINIVNENKITALALALLGINMIYKDIIKPIFVRSQDVESKLLDNALNKAKDSNPMLLDVLVRNTEVISNLTNFLERSLPTKLEVSELKGEMIANHTVTHNLQKETIRKVDELIIEVKKN